jgi:hypothetical protein
LKPFIIKNRRNRDFNIEQGFIRAALHGTLIHPEAGGRIRLRVKIHDQNMLALSREIRTQVDSGGGLAYPTFLVDKSIDASHVICDLQM